MAQIATTPVIVVGDSADFPGGVKFAVWFNAANKRYRFGALKDDGTPHECLFEFEPHGAGFALHLGPHPGGGVWSLDGNNVVLVT